MVINTQAAAPQIGYISLRLERSAPAYCIPEDIFFR
jgi:hypothetical protein